MTSNMAGHSQLLSHSYMLVRADGSPVRAQWMPVYKTLRESFAAAHVPIYFRQHERVVDFFVGTKAGIGSGGHGILDNIMSKLPSSMQKQGCVVFGALLQISGFRMCINTDKCGANPYDVLGPAYPTDDDDDED